MKWMIQIALMASLVTTGIAVPAQKTGRGAELASLNRYVGKYPFEIKLWKKEPLNRRLRQLLKADYPKLIQNTQVSGPLQKEGTLLFMTGNKTHDGGENDACLLIDTRQDVINVLININKKIRTYKERQATLPLPKDAKIWLDNIKMVQ